MKRLYFTIIELLVVIAVIAILTAFLFTGVRAAIKKARINRCYTEMANIASAAQGYYTSNEDVDVYKADMESNGIPFNKLRLRQRANIDPWGEEYRIDSVGKDKKSDMEDDPAPSNLISSTNIIIGKFIRVYSYGPDKESNTEDDLYHTFKIE